MQGRMQRVNPEQIPSRMDSFMFGHRPSPQPMRRNSLPMNLQRLNPIGLLNSPQISKGLSGFSGILNNVQQVLQVVETTTPFIKEYGPMVKNLPAMYRMVKAFKEVDNEPSENQGEEKPNEEEENVTTRASEGKGEEEGKEEQYHKVARSGQSTPKLYI